MMDGVRALDAVDLLDKALADSRLSYGNGEVFESIELRGDPGVDARGVPVKVKNAPHRRKRVRFVYRVTVAPS